MNSEVWKKVPEVNLLWASSLGRVASEPYLTPMPRGGYKTNQMQPTHGVVQKASKSYSRMAVVFRRKTYKIATLVAAAFNGPRPDGHDVSHDDENSHNNVPSNLL